MSDGAKNRHVLIPSGWKQVVRDDATSRDRRACDVQQNVPRFAGHAVQLSPLRLIDQFEVFQPNSTILATQTPDYRAHGPVLTFPFPPPAIRTDLGEF